MEGEVLTIVSKNQVLLQNKENLDDIYPPSIVCNQR